MVNASSVPASSLLVGLFVGLALVVAAMFVAGVHRSGMTPSGRGAIRQTAVAALATVAWLSGTLALGASGRLSFTTKPPTMLVLIAVTIVLAAIMGTSRLGLRLATGLPLAALVGVQAFRFPL